MKTIAILFLFVTGCAVDVPSVSEAKQGLCTEVCDPFSGECHWEDCGGPGGSGGPDGSGGGAGGCPTGEVPDANGGCVPTPSGNRCGVLVACDPTLGIAAEISCEQTCVSFSARCYSAYRCGTDPSCPEAHIGYCGVF